MDRNESRAREVLIAAWEESNKDAANLIRRGLVDEKGIDHDWVAIPLRAIAAALRESEEWRRDAERMDWLERVGFSTQNPQTGERTMNVHCYGPVNGRKWTAHYISSQFETARAAIDAARKEGV